MNTKFLRFISMLLCWFLLAGHAVAAQIEYTSKIANLIDRSKLATLGVRASNPRVQKAVYWLAVTRGGS